MLKTTQLRAADYPVRSWKNGQGETRDIAADDREPFRWRLSWATIPASGPFSTYPGYDRTLVVWRGGPVGLSHQGKPERRLAVLQAHPFKGEWETHASVGAPADDFNSFALREAARVGVYPTFIEPGEDLQFPIAGQEHFVFGLFGEIEILEPNSDQRFHLGPQETLRVSRADGREYLNLRARGGSARAACLWVVVRLL